MSEYTGTGFGSSGDGVVADPLIAASGEGADESAMKVLSARGTEDGLVLRIDGRAEWNHILSEIRAFLGTRRRFIEGGQVSVEWLERLPTKEQSQELEDHLKSEYGIAISGRRRRPAFTTITNGSEKRAGRDGGRDSSGRDAIVPLFEKVDPRGETEGRTSEPGRGDEARSQRARQDLLAAEREELARLSSRRELKAPDPAAVLNIDEFQEASRLLNDGPDYEPSQYGMQLSSGQQSSGSTPLRSGKGIVNRIAKILGEEVQYEEDANAKLVFGTLRSGQRIETPFSLIVVGDVNPGADLIAGGDIIVLGSLRGTAHAAAYDDESQERIIFSLSMQPMQLRIGSVISRGSEDAGGYPEVARVENRRVIVEAFQPRSGFGKKLR